MTCSLQTYRIKIGTYNAGRPIIKRTHSNKTPSSRKNLQKTEFILSLLLANYCLLALSLPGFKTQYRPSKYPTNTACHISSGLPGTAGTLWKWKEPPWPDISCPPSLLHNLYRPPSWPPDTYPTRPWPSTTWSPSAWTPPSLPQLQCKSIPDPVLLAQHLLAPTSWLSVKDRNRLIKSLNGNRGQRGRGIKLLAWNKGSSLLQNKHNEVEAIIAGHQPHVLGLSEANLRSDVDLSLVQHENYQLHTAPTISNPDLAISRVVVYTHSSLIVKRRPDLEKDTISAIWLEVGLPRKRKILVANIYREWKHLNDHQSGTVAAQLERWCLFLSMWETALNEGKEVMVLGDVNLDFLKWTRNDLPASDHTVRLRPLTDQLFQKIIPDGVSQLVQVATRVWPGTADSGLDHIYSNKPEKCSDIYTQFSGGSD